MAEQADSLVEIVYTACVRGEAASGTLRRATNAPGRQSPSSTTMVKTTVVRQDVPSTVQPPL